ncbi:DNA polymerase II [Simiduia curdlanivorans]|uniref:DNA polymerase n=1 Tax=Simiduia curdlanivorans TaxID=1492769 RepID=A0ABV8V346_9GAMM|nr:DNA polymerase II [Simiduia curdlanivorans]MDN3638368.1 DNA polymerase II [Simiduia curdlanivorans]
MTVNQGFLLTRDWRDARSGLALEFWLATSQGSKALRVTNQESVCFFLQSDHALLAKVLAKHSGWRAQALNLTNHQGLAVSALYSRSHVLQRNAVSLLSDAGITTWESDIRPADRYLMERFITADIAYQPGPVSRGFIAPKQIKPAAIAEVNLKVLSIDIETSMDGLQLFSIALQGPAVRRVYMVGASEDQHLAGDELDLIACASARECLDKFLRAVRLLDPDILIGWNVIGFDLWMLQRFCDQQSIKFNIGRDGSTPRWREEPDSERRYIHIAGRVALDGIDLVKAAAFSFDSYSLQQVSESVLGTGKLIAGSDGGAEITRLFNEDKTALARYNLQDCQLVSDIFAKLNLLDFAIARARLTGLPLDRIGGSVAAFEYAYLPLLHRAGFVAPNLGEIESDVISPGGYVMDSTPGLYSDVLVLDFKSLYPSIIRSFLIDPCGYWRAKNSGLKKAQVVQGFNEAFFAREGHLLPGIIEKLWSARDSAKAEKNQPLSYAIKIIMNSFYGVLGSEGCRFFDPRVCSSITLRGHEIIQRSKQWIEAQGFAVIYGDTDSLFVWAGDAATTMNPEELGQSLAAGLNLWWAQTIRTEHQLNSALEVEFETHFKRFFMPTIRGSEAGSKKRYAGIITNQRGADELIFKGLESVRTDWTRLARDFQTELYWRLFHGEAVDQWIVELVAALRAGAKDEQLVYRKRLRRKLEDYAKSRPPHVQAAHKLAQVGLTPKRGEWVEYFITTNGPEPKATRTSAIDYQHYLDRQLQPVADAILPFFGYSFSSLIEHQIRLL